jgi:hypothetical protein
MSKPNSFANEHRSYLQAQLIDANQLDTLKNWYPVSIDEKTGELIWRDMGDQRFSASFFQDSLHDQAHDQRRVCKTKLDALDQFDDFIQPSAFIFHVSRCGSTLMTQMLSTLSHCIVLSEPPVIDMFFNTMNESKETNIATFQKLIHALGQRRFANEKNVIIKLDSWHLGQIRFIREAFPNTPMLFLYREPRQVLASHQRQRGPQMIPDFVNFGDLQVEYSTLSPGDLDAYCLAVLDQFYSAAIQHHAMSGLQLINYSELPAIIWEKLLSQLAIDCNAEELAQMKARSQFHSKHPQNSFEGDPTSQQAHPHLSITQERYQQLENLRLKTVEAVA